MPPVAGTATSRFTASVAAESTSASPGWASCTQMIHRRSGVMDASAYRSPPGFSGTGVTGMGSNPGSSRQMRWSAPDTKKTVSPASHQAPPPYSCTFDCADVPVGSTSANSPLGLRRTIWVRPASLGRPSDHQMASSLIATSPSRDELPITRSALMGERHDP